MKRFAVKMAACVLALSATLGVAQASQAATVNWTLSNGAFDDGGAFSGVFTVDTATDTITDWDVTTTAASGGGGVEYTPSGFFSSASDNGQGPTFATVPFFPILAVLDFTNIPLSGPGSVTMLTGSENAAVFGIFPIFSRDITGGTAIGVLQSGVPEPAAWSMLVLGLGGVGAAMRISRRGSKAAPSAA